MNLKNYTIRDMTAKDLLMDYVGTYVELTGMTKEGFNLLVKYAEAYHLAKLNEITEKDIIDKYKTMSDHTSYDWVHGAKAILNQLKNNESK